MQLRFRFISIVMVMLLSTDHAGLAQDTNTRIAFMSDRDGNREIYSMNPDGTDVRRLTNNDAQDLQPTWSPDKSRIAFISNRSSNFAIYVMNADGSNQQLVSTDQFAYHEYPAWSPDGRYLAYASDKAGSFDVYIMETNGNNPQRLTNGESYETEPAWSPDGRQIAYLQQDAGAFEIFTISTSGGTPQRLIQGSGGDYFSPRWSPDGSRVAYAVTVFDPAGNNSEIYIRDMAAGQESILVSRENSFIQGLSWSEDGSTLVYQAQEIQGKWVIYRINIVDGTLEILTEQEYNSESPAWFTPQSSLINLAESGFGSGGLQVGGSATVYTTRGDTLNLRTRPNVRANIVTRMDSGTVVTLIGGPQSASGYIWWNVRTDWGQEGWAVESADGIQTLVPGGQNLPPSSTYASGASCPGAMPTLFAPGDTAVVDFNASGALRILTNYSGGARRTIAQLYDNDRIELLDGPFCSDSVNYWKVYYRPANAYGWIAEGRNNDRFLCPASNPECS